eukprot:4274194-Prymnesium_polylepis.1
MLERVAFGTSPSRASVLGEFGGLSYRLENHTLGDDGWGYKQVDSGCDDFVGNMTELWRKVRLLLSACRRQNRSPVFCDSN